MKRGEERMQSLVFKHLSLHGHNGFIEDCSITLTDKTDGADLTGRVKECYSYGLNPVD